MEFSPRVTYKPNEHVGVRPMSMAATLKDSIDKGISRSAHDPLLLKVRTTDLTIATTSLFFTLSPIGGDKPVNNLRHVIQTSL
jgi:hypothetical protein